MKIRLVIPECSRFDDGYCEDSWNEKIIGRRIKALEAAMLDPTIDLVVTSHNYLWIDPGQHVNAEPIISRLLVSDHLNRIKPASRTPLVIGFDLECEEESKGKYKKSSKKKERGGKHSESEWRTEDHLNPFGGIDAVVCALNVGLDRNFVLETYIWEAWNPVDCDRQGFIDQNDTRIFSFNNKNIGLLSCGDMFLYCHENTNNLPAADIYLDLSHSAYTGRYKRTPEYIVNHQKANHMLIAMQVKNIDNYDKKYPWVFPGSCLSEIKHVDEPNKASDASWFAFVDCQV